MGQAPNSQSRPCPHIGVRRPIVELLVLGAPTVAQQLSYTLMQFIDTWMLAFLGTHAPTAAANSGLLAFTFICPGIGLLWVVNTLVSQNYGQGDRVSCGRYLWQGLWFSLAFAALLMPVVPYAAEVFRAFGHEEALVPLEASYFRIVISFAVLKLAGTALGQFLLAINRPGQVFAATIIGVLANIAAAWVMIFGRLGLPQMGLAGAAWAQNVGVAVETAILLAMVLRPVVRRTYHSLDWPIRWRLMRNLLMVGVPSGVQFIADLLAWSVFSLVIMARFGTDAMAAQTFMMRYMIVSFMPAFGLATAVTALTGRYIGMGRIDLVRARVRLGFLITASYMVCCGFVFFLWRDSLIGVFSAEVEVRRVGAMLLTFAAVYQFFDAMYIIYNGALRGAGDTFVPAVALAALNWTICVGGGSVLAVWRPQWGPAGPWTAVTGYGIILGLFIYLRFRRGRWQSISLADRD